MDLRKLQYFLAVVEEGSIRGGARRLHMAQPALSRALRQLEQELGLELLDRTASGISPTPAGRQLFADAQAILARVADTTARMRRLAEERSAVLRVGLLAGPIAAGELTEPILSAYAAVRPDVQVRLTDVGMAALTGPVVDGDVDVALLRAPVEHPDLEVVPIACEPRMLVVGHEHALADAGEVCVDDILDLPCLPVDAPVPWMTWCHLDDQRGRPNASAGG